MKKTVLILLIVLISCLIFSCSTKELERTADQLISDGNKAFTEEDYEKASKDFKKLKEWYPFSKHVVLAEQKIADSYFKLEKYPEAISAYEEFEKLHPKNDLIPYINYQKALCHFKQIDTIDRDQKHALEAFKIFTNLIKRFPESSFAEKSKLNLKKCKESLAGHEFYVGEFYYKSEHFKGALKRFENLLKNYPDTSYKEQAENYIKLCNKKLKNKR